MGFRSSVMAKREDALFEDAGESVEVEGDGGEVGTGEFADNDEEEEVEDEEIEEGVAKESIDGAFGGRMCDGLGKARCGCGFFI